MAKPSIPQGMRDFEAVTVQKRNYILDTIKKVFALYGFQPLETPAMENLETLTGKYGEEGDKLIFKVLNNGLQDPKNAAKAEKGFEDLMKGKSSADLTERALKYDLTIPFARYVAMNAGKLTFPFKRYQVQQVWRADRPQKGRYREFTQCDVDVVGSKSLWNEVELTNIYHQAFTDLQIPDYDLRINNRKLLAALSQKTNTEEKLTAITVVIDKLDKIGIDKVVIALEDSGLNQEQVVQIKTYLNLQGSNTQKITALRNFFGDNELATSGINDLEFITDKCTSANLTIDLTLARGLNYYTGTIYEVKAPASVSIGSIAGGGRYDDLTGLFGVADIPGVGISFGIDRIYDVLEELDRFPKNIEKGADCIFFNLGNEEMSRVYPIMQNLRRQSISCEIIAENSKLDKQFKYAEKKMIEVVILLGKDELDNETVTIKHLPTGKQINVPLQNLSAEIIAFKSLK